MSQAFSYTQPYTEEHVTQDLSAKALLFIELMLNQAKQNKDYGEQIATKNALQRFGFSNSQNAKMLGEMTEQMQQYTAATDALAFMEEVWQKFGKEAMVVRYDHFFEILEKYDMVCGSFDRYTGAIPQEAIDTLNHLAEMWERKEFSERYGLKLGYMAVCRTMGANGEDIPTLIKRIRMPQEVSDKSVTEQIRAVTNTNAPMSEELPLASIADALFIAAPAADMKPLGLRVAFYTPKITELRKAKYPVREPKSWSEPTEWLRWSKGRDAWADSISHQVKAEEERLKNIFRTSDINRYAKIEFISEEPEIVRMLRDPFICSLTKYGVLIHAKWGAEAEDATIKRYEQLRNAVIGK